MNVERYSHVMHISSTVCSIVCLLFLFLTKINEPLYCIFILRLCCTLTGNRGVDGQSQLLGCTAGSSASWDRQRGSQGNLPSFSCLKTVMDPVG